MNGEQFDLRERQAASRKVLSLTLVVKRVLDGYGWQAVRAGFGFDPDAPMVVSVVLTPPRGPSVIWRIGRELLYQGLFEESGEGSVQAWPALGQEGEVALLLLESQESNAVLELPVRLLADWLERTYEIVPAEEEAEALDWDEFISDLLDGQHGPMGG